MRDPHEGLAADGTITTGVERARVPAPFEPVLERAIDAVRAIAPEASIELYGSVATGEAIVPSSDVDLLTIGAPPENARAIGRRLSAEFAELCRGVELAPAQPADLHGSHDEAYGFRLFLRHYCVHLAGPDPAGSTTPFVGDARAARGLNGDIAAHLGRWRAALGSVGAAEAVVLGRRVGRKTLLAVAGLVSVHDGIWTTDRSIAADRWGRIHQDLAGGLDQLHGWATAAARADRVELTRQIDTTVARVAEQFADRIGLW